jgi:hypothetical protein
MKKLFAVCALCMLSVALVNAQDLKPQRDKATKKYGYVNKAKEFVIPPTWDKADRFRDGFAIVYMNKKEGLIDEKGTVIIEPQFDKIEKFKNNIAIVKESKKLGFVDNTGKILCEPKFDDLEDDFSSGIFHTKNGSTWGVIDISGKELFEPQFLTKLKFDSKGYSLAIKKIGTGSYDPTYYGIVKRDGSIVLECEQLRVVPEGNRYIVSDKNGKWKVYDNDINPISTEFDNMESFLSGLTGSSKYINDGIIAAKLDNKWGFINEKGETLIPFKFDKIGAEGHAFSQNLCAVKVGEKWGYIDKKGNFLKEPQFEEVKRFIALGAEVVFEGKKYILKPNGEMTLMPGQDTQPQATAAAAPAQQKPATPAPATKPAQQAAAKPAQAAAPAANEWLIGTWKVTSETIGGKKAEGNRVKFVNFVFKKGGSGSYLERTDITANQTQNKNMQWSLAGNSLKIVNLNYTLTPSADKKTMTMKNMLGSWTLVKQ